MPKISVIIPVYNVEQYIDKCLDSIVNQSYKDYEVIIVNDGTKDNSVEIINKYLKKYDNFRLFNKENGGVSSARNYGLKKATGEYVVFIDPDDLITNNFLDKLITMINIDHSDVSISNYQFIKELDINLLETNNTSKTTLYNKTDFLKLFLKRQINFVLPTMLINKELLLKNNICFAEDISFSEDQYFIWLVLLNASTISYSNDALYGYYLRPLSTMTSSSKNKIIDSYLKLETKYQSFDFVTYPFLKYALYRWKLGALYTSAKLLSYQDFLEVIDIMDGKKIFTALKGFKEIKSELLSLLLKLSPKLFYFVCHKII